MPSKADYLTELERRHGPSPELDELRRRHAPGLYESVDNVEQVATMSKEVFGFSRDFGIPLDAAEENYNIITQVADPKDITEPFVPEQGIELIEEPEGLQLKQAPPPTRWQKVKGFFLGDRAPLPPNADRMEKVDRAMHIATDAPMRTFFKFANGKLFGLGEIMWAGIKRIVPEDVWDEEVRLMTLEEATDWAMGYNPSGFAQLTGDIAEFAGRIGTAQEIGVNTGLIGKTPTSIGVAGKALEAAKIFGLAATAEQISKAAATKIDPTETEFGYEGAIVVLRDMAIGAAFSLVTSGVKGAWSKLTPNEQSRALKALGLKKGASTDEIRSAARQIAKQYHPDKVEGMRKEFEAVIKARDTLLKGESKDVIFRGQKITVAPKLLEGEVIEGGVVVKKPPVVPVKPTKPLVPAKVAIKPVKAVEAKRPETVELKIGEQRQLVRELRELSETSQLKAFRASGEKGTFDEFIAKHGEEAFFIDGTPTPPIEVKPEPLITIAPPAQLPRLGGKGAGATTIIPDIATEVTETAKRLGSTISGVGKGAKEIFERNVLRYTAKLRKLGTRGTSVAKDFDEITQRAQKRINNSVLDAKEALKGVTKENRIKIAKAMNKRIKNVPKWIQQRADKLSAVLDVMMNEARVVGIQRKVFGEKVEIRGSGKAFPQVPNAEGEKILKAAGRKGSNSPAVLEVAKEAVKLGLADSVEEYVAQLQHFRNEQLRGISSYLERTRIELPEDLIEWDPDRVLDSLFQGTWLTIEGTRQWGVDKGGLSFPKLAIQEEGIRRDSGPEEANRLAQFVKAAFGQEILSSEASRKISGAIRGYQFFTKIAPSALTIVRNMLDRFAKTATMAPFSVMLKTIGQYPPIINAWIKHSKQIEEEMIRRGAVFSNTALGEGYQPGHLATKIAGKAFAASERGNQVFIALAKKNAIEHNLRILNTNPKIAAIFDKRIGKLLSPLEAIGRSPTQAQRRLRELGSDELLAQLESVDDISPDLLDAVLHKTVRDKAFPVVLSTKRSWWDNKPFMRMVTQFKIWGTDQIGHIWNDVIKDTVQNRDPSKMVRWLVTMAVMGEIYNIIRDFVLGKDESLLATLSDKERRNLQEVSRTILKDMLDGGAVGIMADVVYGLFNLVGGPTLQTVKNLGEAVVKSIWNPKQAKDAIKIMAQQETPALKQAQALLDKVDAQFEKKNITQDYFKVRRQGFDFISKKKFPTAVDKAKKAAVQAVTGWIKNAPTERTLSYELAIRQIIVGDPGDASEHLFFLLKTADSDEELISIEQGITSALNNASPLGKVGDADLGEFFRDMSPEQRRTATSIQLRYDRNAAEAYSLAVTKFEKWRRTQ